MNFPKSLLLTVSIFSAIASQLAAQNTLEIPFTDPALTSGTSLAQAVKPAAANAPQAAYPNLLVNGSFETGDFTGWTVTGNAEVASENASDGSYSCLMTQPNSAPNTEISQSFNTNLGSAYRLTFDRKTTAHCVDQGLRLEVLDNASNDLVLSGIGVGSSYYTYSAVFVARSSVTTLKIAELANVTSSTDAVVDNVQVVQLEPFKYPGTYVGTLTYSHGFPYEKISNKTTRNVTAYINLAGQMFILIEPDLDTYALGTISNDGSVTIGDQNSIVGSAVLRGNKISFTLTDLVHLPNNFYAEPHKRTRVYQLHKVGN